MAGFFKKLLSRFSKDHFDVEDIEESLISGDLGIRLTTDIVDRLQDMGRKLKGQDVVQVTSEEILKILPEGVPPLEPFADRPKIIIVVGVNGTGKTTSTAKLAHYLKSKGHGVTLAAADTFRAAAIEQLQVWAGRLDIPIIAGEYQSDPSSVCYAAYDAAVKNNSDFLIVDTAGRLHTRHNLMEELKKIQRVLGKKDPDAPHEAFIVVDATTGSNALSQAKEFHAAVGLTGLIVTKLDGSGKGGIIVSIQNELDIPTRFIGTGETADDFAPFDAQKFVEEIF
ncbi:MAG: fused signal recognition particle receptor [Verrucomicrobiales bacterium]|jgi:fused signal recognition particle receptor